MSWLIFALISVAFGSAMEITQKRALQGEHTLEYLSVRGIFVMMFLVLLLPLVNWTLPWQGYALATLVGVLASLASVMKNRGVKHLEISTVTPLMNIHPVFVVIIAFLFLGEKMTQLQIGGILLIVVGTYILEIDHKTHDLLSPFKRLFKSQYTGMIILALLMFGITQTLDRFILVNYSDPVSYLVIVYGIHTLSIWIRHGIQYKFKNLKHVLQTQGKKIIWPAIFMILSGFFFYQAASLAYIGLVAAVKRLESLIVTIEGGHFFHETHLPKKTLACVIMAFGAMLIVL